MATKTVKVPIGIRKALWAPVKTQPDAAHPTYDTIVELGTAIKGTLAITTASLSIYGDDVEQLRDESFVSAQLDVETTLSDLELNATIFGHTYSETDGEDSGKDDHAPYGGYGFIEPVLLADKTIVYRATFLRRVAALSSSEKTDSSTRSESITVQNNAISFACSADNLGSWRVRKEFSGDGAEANALSWIKTQFGTAS
jgi:hypothetical protein